MPYCATTGVASDCKFCYSATLFGSSETHLQVCGGHVLGAVTSLAGKTLPELVFCTHTQVSGCSSFGPSRRSLCRGGLEAVTGSSWALGAPRSQAFRAITAGPGLGRREGIRQVRDRPEPRKKKPGFTASATPSFQVRAFAALLGYRLLCGQLCISLASTSSDGQDAEPLLLSRHEFKGPAAAAGVTTPGLHHPQQYERDSKHG